MSKNVIYQLNDLPHEVMHGTIVVVNDGVDKRVGEPHSLPLYRE